MTRLTRLAATTAAMASLACAVAACSPKPTASYPTEASAVSTQAPTTTAGAPGPSALAAQSGASALPATCQSLLASMGTCSDNLTRRGSPLGDQIRLSMTDMRNSIAGAPPAEVSDFCSTEASAFNQRAQAAHC